MTHEKIKALDTLIEAVESGGDAIQHNICIYAAHAFPPESAYGKCTFHEVDRAFRGSIDAAKALHESLLPKHGYEVSGFADGGPFYASVWPTGHRLEKQILQRSINPARAWLIAILKAYRAQQEAS